MFLCIRQHFYAISLQFYLYFFIIIFFLFLRGKLPAKVDKNCNSSWHFAHRKYNNNKLQLQTVLWQQKKKKYILAVVEMKQIKVKMSQNQQKHTHQSVLKLLPTLNYV